MGMGAFKLIDREPKSIPVHPNKQKSLSVHEDDSPPPGMASSPSVKPSLPGQPTSGWSHILEDWYCRGVGSVHGVKPVLSENSGSSPTTSNNPEDGSTSSTPISSPPTLSVGWKTEDGVPDAPPTSNSSPATGPYELLMKERLLGIYIAVFVHKEVKPFVKGSRILAF